MFWSGWCCTQVVVAPHSHIIGRSIKDLRFRTKYDAAIIAVQRRVGVRWRYWLGLSVRACVWTSASSFQLDTPLCSPLLFLLQ